VASVNVKYEAKVRELLAKDGSVRAGALAAALGVSRQTAHARLRALVDSGVLVLEGAGRGSHYRLAEAVPANFTFRYARAGLAEDHVWNEVVHRVPAVGDLSGQARDAYNYALTELVNNAIDHSAAELVEVRVETEPETGALIVDVIDDGVGIFRHVAGELGLASPFEAAQELSKGKTTTMADRHTGEGIFFTSKVADVFVVESDELAWRVDNERDDSALMQLSPPRAGTRVSFRSRPAHIRSLRAIFDEYTDDFEFARTRMVVKLFEYGVTFVSRSEAKRLMSNLDRFEEVVLDFHDVQGVGQGFADEVFRVWARDHPGVKLIPERMNEPVAYMVARARRRAEADGS